MSVMGARARLLRSQDRHRRSRWRAAGVVAVLSLGLVNGAGFATAARAGQVAVATASNFLQPLRRIAAAFEAASGHDVAISAGSTGKLYAQIMQGAPFDVFLAANAREPKRLEAEGEAVAGTRFTYALGTLAVWSATPGIDPQRALRSGDFGRIALANPKLAPYGRAMLQVFDRLGIARPAADRLVVAENVSQALQFAQSGNTTFAAVALSQVRALGNGERGSPWIVDADLYDPIAQQAVLLKGGADNAAAVAFLDYLRGPAGRAAVVSFGYGVE
ncbi:MAG: molybdate ABC transporter substrate-binding protein [Rhodobacterales bacterium]|nr:molybdate ABC transporter substrate-binding protein [Rhodobacterales bacterium]